MINPVVEYSLYAFSLIIMVLSMYLTARIFLVNRKPIKQSSETKRIQPIGYDQASIDAIKLDLELPPGVCLSSTSEEFSSE